MEGSIGPECSRFESFLIVQQHKLDQTCQRHIKLFRDAEVAILATLALIHILPRPILDDPPQGHN